MSLLPVEEALARILDGAAPTEAETVSLAEAHGRTLAEPIMARRSQPPFPVSSMDGYAVRASDATAGARLRVVGESAAGRGLAGPIGPGDAARIFTGAPLPGAADAVLLQEDATAEDGHILVGETVRPGQFVRPEGLDFTCGDTLLDDGRRLGPRELALAAAANHPTLPVRRRPLVAILATGNELVAPGSAPGPDQIVASAGAAVAALAESAGGTVIDLGIVADTLPAIEAALAGPNASGADILVTLGGASVGDHDLVRPALAAQGMALAFWKVALRPGKPLLHGRLGGRHVLGLPGNPVSAIVCGLLFLRPLIGALLGRPPEDPAEPAVLGVDLPANDQRADYLRARLEPRTAALPAAIPLPRQDSSMLGALAAADCLLIRPPHAPAAAAGSPCRIIRLTRFA